MSLFPPPQEIATEVFFSLPDRFRRTGRCPWGDVNNHGAPTHSFLEGPSFDRDGNLYVVDIPYGRIFRISPGGDGEQVAEYDGEPNGLKIHRDGRIFITDYRRGIMVLDPASGSVEPLLSRRHTEHFRGVNDLFFASNGDLYFTDQGQTGLHDPSGRVYRYTAAGRLELLLHNVPSPNGIVLNPAETLLFVAVTRANAVWRAPIMPDGTLSKVGAYVTLLGGAGPDGLAVDAAGGLAVAHAGMGSAWIFSPKGEPLFRVRSCTGDMTTNLAYGGADGRSLFITESTSGTILHARLEQPGNPMFSHR